MGNKTKPGPDHVYGLQLRSAKVPRMGKLRVPLPKKQPQPDPQPTELQETTPITTFLVENPLQWMPMKLEMLMTDYLVELAHWATKCRCIPHHPGLFDTLRRQDDTMAWPKTHN
jgi:hypothetical protein